jgi:hypothetical protein
MKEANDETNVGIGEELLHDVIIVDFPSELPSFFGILDLLVLLDVFVKAECRDVVVAGDLEKFFEEQIT